MLQGGGGPLENMPGKRIKICKMSDDSDVPSIKECGVQGSWHCSVNQLSQICVLLVTEELAI